MKYLLLSVLLFFGFTLNTNSQDIGDFIEAEANGIMFKFKLLNDGTLGLVGNDYKGDIIVPESIEYNGTRYVVTAICGDEKGDYNAGDNVALAFNRTTEVTSLSLPETITYIGDGAFRKTPIEQFVIPNSVVHVGNMFDLEELKEFVCPDSQEVFERYTINNFDKLESVVFGAGLKTIDTPAFDYVPMLKRMRFKTEEPPTLIKDPFDQCGIWDLSKITVYVPKGCIEKYKTAWPDFEFTYREYDPSGISSTDSDCIGFSVKNNIIELNNTKDCVDYELFDVSGKLLLKGVTCDIIEVPNTFHGLYVLRVLDKCEKIYIY